ncbi:AraC family transcriptional regulator [Nocardioides sp. Root614]|nr:AraC family transcriptional regulator [Nocardioides sp. Root614]KRA89147.1 AraC family transcriptional regulator [Nocardioides sp. Root682]
MGQTPIRRVRYLSPGSNVGDIEVNTLAGIRERGGPQEFLTSQVLDFDLLFHLESGTEVHTVDFTDHTLNTGDLLWVRAGQLHQWGRIDDIEGPVVMFGPHAIDDRTSNLIRSQLVRTRNHWTAADLEATPVLRAIGLLTTSIDLDPQKQSSLRQAGLEHSLSALLAYLVLVEPAGGATPQEPTHEAYRWFRDHVEENFRTWHKVSEYADRLGYSTRTLNRLARQHTGLSAKELIDERVVLEAKRQLRHGDTSVAEIAEQLGFDDPSNFSSYFRRRTGTTPGAFRVLR